MDDCAVGLLLDFTASPLLGPAEPAQQERRDQDITSTDRTPDQDDLPHETDDDDDDVDQEVSAITANSRPSRLARHLQDLSIEESRMENPQTESRVPSLDSWITEEEKLIEDEQFDFDLHLSPTSSQAEPVVIQDVEGEDDDDEIFFGSVGFTEQCVSKNVEETEYEEEIMKPLSPLTAEDWVQVFKDAQTVAIRVQNAYKSTSSSTSSSTSEQSAVVASIVASIPVLSPATEQIAESIRNKQLCTPAKSGQASVNSGTVTKSDTVTKSKNSDTVTKKKNSDTITKDKKSDTVTKGKSGVNGADKENKPKARLSFVKKGLFGLKPSKSPLEDLAKAIPRVQTKNVIEFSAKGSVDPDSSQVTKMRRSLQRPTGLQKPATGLTRPANFKSRLNTPKPKTKVVSPLKRRRLNSVESLDDEKASIVTDVSDVSTDMAVPSGKPSAPATKLKQPGRQSLGVPKSAGSRLQLPGAGGHKRSLSNVSNSSDRILRSSPNCLKNQGTKAPAAPSLRVQASNNTQTGKPAIKGAMTKLEMLRPGALQRKTLTVNRSKLAKPSGAAPATGPVKAVGPVKPKLNTTFEAEKDNNEPARPAPALSHPSSMSTPIKQNKKVQPKRLIEGSQSPQRNSDSNLPGTPISTTQGRRSLLPTPNKSRSGSCSSIASSRSSVSSIGSGLESPAVGLLVDFGDLNERSTPSLLLKSRKPKVQHTPLTKDAASTKKPSAWSPIRRARPHCKEDELILCTKRTAQNSYQPQ